MSKPFRGVVFEDDTLSERTYLDRTTCSMLLALLIALVRKAHPSEIELQVLN